MLFWKICWTRVGWGLGRGFLCIGVHGFCGGGGALWDENLSGAGR